MRKSIINNFVALFTLTVGIVSLILSIIVYIVSVKHLDNRLELNLHRTCNAVKLIVNSTAFNELDRGMPNDSLQRLHLLSAKRRDLFSQNLLNPLNYYLRIYDSEKKVIWFTENIEDYSDSASEAYKRNFNYITLSTAKHKATPGFLKYDNFEKYFENNSKPLIRIMKLKNKIYRIYSFKSKSKIISVAQPYNFFIDFKQQLQIILISINIISVIFAYVLALIFLKNPFRYFDELSKLEWSPNDVQ